MMLRKIIFIFLFFSFLFFGYSISYTSCNSTIPSGIHTLDTNITSSGTCFDFQGNDNIYFNCQGNSITGNTSGAGFDIGSVNNVSIVNCNIFNFSTGVFGFVLTENAIFNNITSSFNSNITSDTFFCSGSGFCFANSAENITFLNIITENNDDIGINLESSVSGVYINNLLSRFNDIGLRNSDSFTYNFTLVNSSIYSNNNLNLFALKSFIPNYKIYNNYLGNISKINFIGSNFILNFSNIGNRYDYLTNSPYCFDEPSNTTCDYLASPNTQNQIITSNNIFSYSNILYIFFTFLFIFR